MALADYAEYNLDWVSSAGTSLLAEGRGRLGMTIFRGQQLFLDFPLLHQIVPMVTLHRLAFFA
jgi:hypothetical protein